MRAAPRRSVERRDRQPHGECGGATGIVGGCEIPTPSISRHPVRIRRCWLLTLVGADMGLRARLTLEGSKRAPNPSHVAELEGWVPIETRFLPLFLHCRRTRAEYSRSLKNLARQFQARAYNTLAFRAVARSATH